jgi:hypothetical protein
MTSQALTYARLLVAELEVAERPKEPEPLEVRLAKIFHDGQVMINAIVDDACRKLDRLAVEFVPPVVQVEELKRRTAHNDHLFDAANYQAGYAYQMARFTAMQNIYGRDGYSQYQSNYGGCLGGYGFPVRSLLN